MKMGSAPMKPTARAAHLAVEIAAIGAAIEIALPGLALVAAHV